MRRPNYTIIRCQTSYKLKVMDLLCDATEYQLVRENTDAIYYNGNTTEEKQGTKQLIKSNVAMLIENGIKADSNPEYLDNYLFIQLH